MFSCSTTIYSDDRQFYAPVFLGRKGPLKKSWYKPSMSALVYGGEHAIGKRKGRRPLSLSCSHHVVLRVEDGTASLLRKERKEFILLQIKKWAAHFKVQVYARSVNSNHVHLVIYGKRISDLHGFLRVCPGQIAQKLKVAGEKFWKHLAFTRIVPWGRAFQGILKYVERNTLEAAGLVRYQARKGRYRPPLTNRWTHHRPGVKNQVETL